MSIETTEIHSTHDEHEGMTKKRIIKVALILRDEIEEGKHRGARR